VTCHSVQSVEEGGYELAWDSAIARTLVVGDLRSEFGSDFSYGVDLWPVWNAVRRPTLARISHTTDGLRNA
ncbi:MAG TPA: hypothetical protein VE865_12420, partial [Bradyrhizobium sp.]|nr:hypothetical protein [Bradyrhizobium sp.]